MNGKQYYIHLVQIDEYITETYYDNLWGHDKDISNACWFGDYDSAMKVVKSIAKDKHLDLNFHLEIIKEEVKIIRTRLPIGNVDDWFICPRCSNWCQFDDEIQSRYNNTEYICPTCADDE